MKKLKYHVKQWNGWRKHNRNGKIYKLLVLLGLMHSPTFYAWVTFDDILEKIEKEVQTDGGSY